MSESDEQELDVAYFIELGWDLARSAIVKEIELGVSQMAGKKEYPNEVLLMAIAIRNMVKGLLYEATPTQKAD